MATKKKKKKFYLRDLSFLWQAGVAVLLAWVLITFIGGIVKVTDEGMSPALTPGQSVLTSRFSYKLKSPSRGEIVVYGKGEEKAYFGRVIGLPGDSVEIRDDNTIWINGKEYKEYTTVYIAGQREYPVKLGAGEYFVLAENPNAGVLDSRFGYIGNVAQDELKGKILFLIWPLSDWTIVK